LVTKITYFGRSILTFVFLLQLHDDDGACGNVER